MDVLTRFSNAGIVPVAVLEKDEDAVPTAKALLAGGIDVMEITLRTTVALDAIAAVSAACPDMLVGAGTVVTLEQCMEAVKGGAKFIVSPGYGEEVISWCVENSVAVIPGCITPAEIMMAMAHGLKVVKFFPANIYGGLNAMKALAAPFADIKFIPTGGIDGQTVGEYCMSPFIHAVGGSWLCSKADIRAGNFKKITSLCREARQAALGFEVAHIGINCDDGNASLAVCRELQAAFGFGIKEGNSSNFASGAIEVMKSPYLGDRGHIAIRTNRVSMAIAELEKRGFSVDMGTAKYKNGRMIAVYLRKEIGGFAIHLLQK